MAEIAAIPATPARTGFRPLRVTARVAETERVTSFWLEPVEADGWRAFQAGQFLSFRLPSTDARGKMLRNYSLASAPGDTGRYRICVKRDSPASGATGGQSSTTGQSSTGGQGSGYFHDAVAVGDILHANGPSGNFILKPESDRPVVFVSGDIGITPMVSMLADCAARSRRPLHFIHECDAPEHHIMRRDIEAIAAQRSGVTLRTFYRAAQSGGTRSTGAVAGDITQAALAPLLPTGLADIYLCGPTPFMLRAYAALRGNSITPGQIAHEFFGPLIDLERAYQTSGG